MVNFNRRKSNFDNMPDSMKSVFKLLLLLIIAGCGRREVPPGILGCVDSISTKWAPDKREAVADIRLMIDSTGQMILSGETDLPGLKDEIVQFLVKKNADFVDDLKILPDPSTVKKPWGLVTVSVANIKGEPSHSSEMVSQAIMGTPVKLLKKYGGWYLAQTPDYYIGWINESSIQTLSDSEMEIWKRSERLIYTGRDGIIFPGKDSNTIVSDVLTGSILVDSGRQGGIVKVALPDGRTGWVARDVTTDFSKWCSEIEPDPQRLITFAKSYVGYPYMWGGTSTKAMDCSGFTRTIYFTGGIILARDASQQFLHGINVDISQSLDSLKPGDLLYFGYINKAGKERITHTGMYIGNSEVIHSSGMVQISSLDSTRSDYSPYLRRGLRGVRRIIGAPSARGTEKVAQHTWYTAD